MSKIALAIRHVHFETLGTFEPVLADAGYALRYFDVGRDDFAECDFDEPDLLVVLGGPIGVYEADIYPFLSSELDLLRTRLSAGRSTLGICLGGQLLAAALGAKVKPTGIKEIGFAPVTLTEAGRESPLRHLAGVPVLHWHGDTFEIPRDARHLASSTLCKNQAFAVGDKILAVQFHPEADTPGNLEPWLIGHAAELSAAKIDPRTIRADAEQFGVELRNAGRRMFAEWLERANPD